MSGLSLLGISLLGTDWVTAPSLDDVRAGRAELMMNMVGPAVTFIQKQLGLSGSAADGKFGDKTQALLKTYQSRWGLPTTGVVDKDTLLSFEGTNVIRDTAPPLPPMSFPMSNDPVAAAALAAALEAANQGSGVSVPAPGSSRPGAVGAPRPAPVANKSNRNMYIGLGVAGVAALGAGYLIFGEKK